jgi:hypothetical protein
VLVAKGHWLQCQDRFADLIQRLNVILEPRGGGNRAKLTVGLTITSTPFATVAPANPGDIGGSLLVGRTDPGLVSLSSDTRIADINVVSERSDVRASVIAQCDSKMIRGSTLLAVSTNVHFLGIMVKDNLSTSGMVIVAIRSANTHFFSIK